MLSPFVLQLQHEKFVSNGLEAFATRPRLWIDQNPVFDD